MGGLWNFRFQLIFHSFIILLENNVSGSYLRLWPDCSTEGLFKIFQTNPSYSANPRPYWLDSEDPLQPKPHKVTKWVIHEQEIWASQSWSRNDFKRDSAYKLRCQQSKRHDGKFNQRLLFQFVDDEGTADSDRYVCIGLVSRSALIFQVGFSEVVKRSSLPSFAEICEQHSLTDTGTTFVNFEDSSTGWNKYVESFAQNVPCPNFGGYSITSWRDQNDHTECSNPFTSLKDSRLWHLRVEYECDNGDGIVFSEESPSSTCKNPFFGELYESDTLRCFAAWSEQEYVYAIALTEFPEAAYCLRVPLKRSEGLQVHIFKDGICDLTSGIFHSKKYMKMDLIQYHKPSVSKHGTPSYTILDPRVPSNLQGNWYKKTLALGEDHISITEDYFNSTRLGNWQFVASASCAIETQGIQNRGHFYFAISRKGHGCRPRLALIWLTNFSKSVLGFQLSQSVIINNEEQLKNLSKICEKFNFVETNNILKDKYHIEAYGWYNLVSVDESISLTDCNLPRIGKMNATLAEGKSCIIDIEQKIKTTFSVTIRSCNQSLKDIELHRPIEHQCMATYNGKYKYNTFVITKTPQKQINIAKQRYNCWLFSNEESRGLVMPIGDCNDETIGQVFDAKTKGALLEFDQKSVGEGTPLVSSMFMLVSIAILSLPFMK